MTLTKVLAGALALVLVAGMTSPAFADAVEWDGDAFPDIDWDNPLNWSSDLVPETIDDITIPSSFKANINTPKTIDGTLTIDSNAEIVVNTGSLEISSTGSLTNSGILNMPGTSTVNFGNVANVGKILMNSGGVFTNKDGGIVNNNSQGDISNNNGGTFTNEFGGTVNNIAGFINNNNPGTNFNNSGLLVNDFVIRNNVGASFTNQNGGVIDNNNGGTITNFDSSIFTNELGAQINNNGDFFNHCNGILIDSGVISPNSVIQLPCPPDQLVSGELLPLDSTALLIGGISSMSVFMIPAVAGIAGAGIYLVKFRANRN